MIGIPRLQSYLRRSATGRYDVQSVPPFTLFFHPTDNLVYLNYAVPEKPIGDKGRREEQAALARTLARLIDAFRARGRVPRLEYLDEYAPGLRHSLAGAGFVEEARQSFMVCVPAAARPAPDVPGLTIEALDRRATLAQARAFWDTQRMGFDPGADALLTDEEVGRLLDEIEGETLLLGTLEGQPVSAGMLMSAVGGIVELAGLATLPPCRRRGIASALTAHALHTAFTRGIEAVCLTAEDERAGRIYARLGFTTVATACAWRMEGQ